MDSPGYPLSKWLDRGFNTAIWVTARLLLLVPLMMLPLRAVRAQSWELEVKVLPQPLLTPLISADISGNGADELLGLTEDRQLGVLTGLTEPTLQLQLLAAAPPGPPEFRPYRFPSSPPLKDRIAWIAEGTLLEWTIQPGSPPLARSFTLPPPGRYFPQALGWQCKERKSPWIGAILPGEESCVGIFCLEPLPSGELPARLGGVICDHRGAPMLGDVDASGLHAVLQSDPKLQNWTLSRESSSRLWASFPSRVTWHGALIADFDADRRDDILVFGEPFKSASIAYSKGSYSLERPVPWPFPAEIRQEHITVGDFDGDGRSDLAALPHRSTKLLLAFARDTPTHRAPGKGAVTDFNSPQHEPAVCLGYHPFAALGAPSKWGNQSSFCPPGSAYFGALEGLVPDAARNAVLGSCCRLPRADILLDEHLTATVECPDGYVITGSEGMAPSLPTKLRCTRINSLRYSLGPLREGRYWGNGLSSRGQSEQLQLTDIPAAIRSAIGRADDVSWALDGCVGTPIGALLVKKGGKHCQESGYRELLEDRKPVTMFPDCREIENIFDPTSGCR